MIIGLALSTLAGCGSSSTSPATPAGYDMTTLDGAFDTVASREFEPGSFYIDMAQPMANAAFYYLEPQARDGFVGWWVFDQILKDAKTYPVFKVRRQQ